MIHHHRAVTLLVVNCIFAFTAFAQPDQAEADSSVCEAFRDSSKLYSFRFDAIDSLKYYGFKVRDCAFSIGHDELYLEGLSIIGVAYLRENDYEKAYDYFELNRTEALRLGDSLAAAMSLINLANVHLSLDSLPKAMQELMDCAEILEKQQDSTMLVYVYNNLAITMGKIFNRAEQLKFSRAAFEIGGGKIKDKKTLTLACNLAINYLNARELDSSYVDSSETLGLLVLEKSREFGNIKTTTQILNHLTNITMLRGIENDNPSFYRKAIAYADEVLSYEGKLQHSHTFCYAYGYKGSAHIKLNEPIKAIESLEKSLALSEEGQGLQRLRHSLSMLHQAYAMNGEYEKAYATLERFKSVSDTLSSENNIKILNELETKYETEKKEQQVRELSQQNQIAELKLRQRSIWIIVLIIAAIAVAGAIFFVSRQRLLKEQQDALENKLLSLRVQLNPHFIFNALTAVQNYMLSGKDLRKATRYLSNFAKVMRAFLEYNQEEVITLEKELYALGLYVGIQELRFSNGFDFEVNVDDEILPEETLVPPMIMQPLIENAIEHGIRNVENGKITLSYKLNGNRLEIRLEDNGIGRRRAALGNKKAENKTSLATKITTERISLLNRKGHGSYVFTINDAKPDGTGTVVVFTIPFQES